MVENKDTTKLPEWTSQFLKFGENEPVNRIAYTEADIKYKCEIMKKMQDMGLKISIDLAGNICGTIEGEDTSRTELAYTSHTDSVPNGGQYDGPVGIISGLAAMEKHLAENEEKKPKGNIKLVICACEESSRFNVACIGSKYLAGKIGKAEFLSIKDKDGISLKEAVSQSYEHLKKYATDAGIDPITLKDAVVGKEECENEVELHIEQYESLQKYGMDIGAVRSIVGAYRMMLTAENGKGLDTMSVEEKQAIILAISKFTVELDKRAKENPGFRSAVPGIEGSPYSMNQICDRVNILIDAKSDITTDEDIKRQVQEIQQKTGTTITMTQSSTGKIETKGNSILIEVEGTKNHTGSTPMEQRKDAMVAASQLILAIKESAKQNPDLEANIVGMGTGEKNAINEIGNQITMPVDIRPQIATTEIDKEVQEIIEQVEKETGAHFDINMLAKNDPTIMTPSLYKGVYDNACSIGKKAIGMPSWAGHDTSYFPSKNRILIFIPSEGGSHNPKENTTEERMYIGVMVLSKVTRDILNNREKAVVTVGEER